MNFSELTTCQPILDAIKDLNFDTPTDIQQEAIPVLQNHTGDFVGQAQTGTGKTGAFVIPLLERIDFTKKNVQSLILAPTRELAHQISEELIKFGKYLPMRSTTVYGGVSYQKQINALKKDFPHIVVGTPGRVLDLIDKGILNLALVKITIIDEADEMLNMGFLEDVETILKAIKGERKIWMFSATMPRQILKIINDNFTDPQIVRVQKKAMSSENINQSVCVLEHKHFNEAICRIVETKDDFYGIVFCQTKQETKDLADRLLARGISVAALHGDLSQADRDQSMMKFRNKKVQLLVCTDVAARGLDISNVTHVINFGVPKNFESYVHRIGRTGRCGLAGEAITLATPGQLRQVRRIEIFTKNRIDRFKIPSAQDVKRMKIKKELKEMESLKQAIMEKKDSFKIDESFTIFKEHLDGLSADDVLKLMFSWKFNFDLRQIDNIGELGQSMATTASRPKQWHHPESNRRRQHHGRSATRRAY
ncbi:MAG: hypothetical protein A2504_15345 [Bdellovibrionales bacterium RIFOXYD12_FULL_39_22]|nr:MAG: hypothetical protein A2385_02775 [Bdellovibrionales bacterium RIFOXYB1_FULL_39_21]OFZ43171.1 MAG: hypothetical protein A2485_11920 [Bdellovibrionales bacterium RIFOXYC12_FULL_39_17]OFZ47909.1 MAG: hypothetical protein A2404_16560 [Bdellovibrionales bacterium RIFOXYC1_FULL_39_130]OFZ75689.1 MAG: hypothetical protein A2560_13060 [Bdellovibrionales bacterium RIFOXYD1_FULL_39_84]OFZ94179.1 MAG: hypothetical protein A2504_15345 [Bdellovibrionales bacterium RIFOXYD12_FULL_39_22]HLE11755.1 DE